ncbi:hypothetical protein L596_008395 [Steinernema carpocapsae]|uniref:Uncharacterized protein n=1 Tax=Steinernema carpocapsae TaxID=34508 RepID=A0A4U5PCG2_STECR|nr:hypothetical protein L596_008395 [Steinernema carpocapsae]
MENLKIEEASSSGTSTPWFLQNLPVKDPTAFSRVNDPFAEEELSAVPVIIRSFPLTAEERRIEIDRTPLLVSQLRDETNKRREREITSRMDEMYRGSYIEEMNLGTPKDEEEDETENFADEECSSDENTSQNRRMTNRRTAHEQESQAIDAAIGRIAGAGNAAPNPTPPPRKRPRRFHAGL